MAVLKQKKVYDWNFTYCLQKLECCHELRVFPNFVSISCWRPLNSLSCFPAWACHIEAQHSVCTGDLTYRKWKLWMCCVCVCAVCVCVRVGIGAGWKWGLKQDMLGITQSTKSVTWSETELIYLASERICCMWFGGENVFLLCSQCAQTQHMETFSERPMGPGEKAPDILFLLPLFIAFSVLFFPTDWITYICLPHVEISP